MPERLPGRSSLVACVGLLAIAIAFLSLSRGADQATPRKKILVRRDIASLAPDGPEIAAFRKAVAVMKSRPASDPTSWDFQANIHTQYCQHGNYFFLPWHRMYGYWIERVMRDASGDPNFTIPYWNYSNPAARALPEAFRIPADPKTNSLYVVERNKDAGGLNNGARLPAAAAQTFWRPFRITNFATKDLTGSCFGGLVVASPLDHPMSTMGSFESYHNAMHVLLGGEGGLMSDLGKSSLDPLFFIHHHNVDRLWKRWLDQGGGRANPTDDAAWMNADFPFWDEKGKQVSMKVSDALDTEAQLGYRYDDDSPPQAQAKPAKVADAREQKPLASSNTGKPYELSTEPLRVTIDLGKEAATAARRNDGALSLELKGIRFEKEPMVIYEVYLNLPEKDAPDIQGPHYVGNIVFAGIAPDGAAVPKHTKPHSSRFGSKTGAADVAVAHTRAFDVAGVVRELQARKLWSDDRLTVTFVMTGLVPVGNAPVSQPGVKARFDKIVLSGD
jgi:tyrosinase